MTRVISFDEADPHLNWIDLTHAIEAGHSLPKASIDDTFLYRDPDTLLSRSAWIDGLGVAVKSATVFPGNPSRDRPMINGAVSVFDDFDGSLTALLDFHLVTKWKTAGDSLLAALRLAPKTVDRVLIIGSGTVAGNLIDAYRAAFPDAAFFIWGRSFEKAQTLASQKDAVAVQDLPGTVESADIIGCATMSTEPVLQGEWLSSSTHIDLIGAYRPDMREVDDTVLARARVFVDSFETTVEHIGEIKIPIASGALKRADILADYYTLDAFKRSTEDEITVCKNGGGAHLDLMTCRYILKALEQ
jgi:ornithine cyclodeaminase/alanine dehydrogenase-like protein (mu-crystallin family)